MTIVKGLLDEIEDLILLHKKEKKTSSNLVCMCTDF